MGKRMALRIGAIAALAGGLALALPAGRAAADPPPWSHGWKHHHDDDHWRHHDWDRDRRPYYPPYAWRPPAPVYPPPPVYYDRGPGVSFFMSVP
jgi:hypothetical protein